MGAITTDTLPRRRDDVTVSIADDRTVLHAADGSTHVLNPTAHALWVLCDGATSPTEIAAAVCEVFDVDPRDAVADVLRALDTLVADGLVEVAP